MKKIFLVALISACTLHVFASDPVDAKVLESFNKTFKNVENVSWSTSEYTYEVRFDQDKVSAKITYDKNGNIVRTMRYYTEEKLPLMVLTKVKNKYSDKKIFGVVELSSDEGTFYHITLEDANNWLNVKADSYGSTSVESKFKKA
jgi:hypothetical protein